MSGLLNDLVSQVKATHHGKSVELCLKIADLYCPHFTSRNLGEFTDQLLDLKMTIFSQKTYEYNWEQGGSLYSSVAWQSELVPLERESKGVSSDTFWI